MCQLLGRSLRVDHVAKYKKERLRENESERKEQMERMERAKVVRAWRGDDFSARKGEILQFHSFVG